MVIGVGGGSGAATSGTASSPSAATRLELHSSSEASAERVVTFRRVERRCRCVGIDDMNGVCRSVDCRKEACFARKHGRIARDCELYHSFIDGKKEKAAQNCKNTK